MERQAEGLGSGQGFSANPQGKCTPAGPPGTVDMFTISGTKPAWGTRCRGEGLTGQLDKPFKVRNVCPS